MPDSRVHPRRQGRHPAGSAGTVVFRQLRLDYITGQIVYVDGVLARSRTYARSSVSWHSRPADRRRGAADVGPTTRPSSGVREICALTPCRQRMFGIVPPMTMGHEFSGVRSPSATGRRVLGRPRGRRPSWGERVSGRARRASLRGSWLSSEAIPAAMPSTSCADVASSVPASSTFACRARGAWRRRFTGQCRRPAWATVRRDIGRASRLVGLAGLGDVGWHPRRREGREPSRARGASGLMRFEDARMANAGPTSSRPGRLPTPGGVRWLRPGGRSG
jgi:hypothetical protein